MKITPLLLRDGQRRGDATSQVQFPKTPFHPRLPPLPWRGAARGSPQAPLGRPGPLLPARTSVASVKCWAFWSRRVPCPSRVWISSLTPPDAVGSFPVYGTSLHWRRGRKWGCPRRYGWSTEAHAWGAKCRGGNTKYLKNQQKCFVLRSTSHKIVHLKVHFSSI